MNFIEEGIIKNSVNFPEMEFARQGDGLSFLCRKPFGTLATNYLRIWHQRQHRSAAQRRGDAIAAVVETSADAYDLVDNLNDELLACEGMKNSRVLFQDGRIGGCASTSK